MHGSVVAVIGLDRQRPGRGAAPRVGRQSGREWYKWVYVVRCFMLKYGWKRGCVAGWSGS